MTREYLNYTVVLTKDNQTFQGPMLEGAQLSNENYVIDFLDYLKSRLESGKYEKVRLLKHKCTVEEVE